MGLDLRAFREPARAFEHDVDALPRELRGIGLGGHGDRSPVRGETVLDDLDGVLPASVDRVVGEEVGEHLLARQIVHVHELDVGAIPTGTQQGATDPAEPVDCNSNGHAFTSGPTVAPG